VISLKAFTAQVIGSKNPFYRTDNDCRRQWIKDDASKS